MVTLRDELTVDDLISVTGALRKLKPKMKDLICVGIEVPQPNDRSVVFHVMTRNDDKKEPSIVIISAEYILEVFGGTGNMAERKG